MSVDAIGSSVGSGIGQIQRAGLDQAGLLRIFLTQLSFQDPLQPVDSREFLAQLAQFTNIQQTQTLNENLTGLLAVQSVSQSVALLGRTVQVTQNGQNIVGTVTTLQFQGGQPVLVLRKDDGTFIQNVRPSQITLIR